jgi:hypothetical protein
MTNRQLLRTVALAAAVLAIAAVGCGRAAEETARETTADPRGAFFENLGRQCGQRFEGRAVHSATENDPMLAARLEMHVATCADSEIRIPFRVGEDRSRTWVLTRGDDGLLLKHDHRHADGTPDEITMYGGWARAGGTALRQSFPADEATAAMLPAAATNVWTLELDPGRQFVYDLTRHDQPRFRAEFDLARPLE